MAEPQDNGHAVPHAPNRHIAENALPPQNLEAERGVLGGCILDNGWINKAKDLIKPVDFFRDTHAEVFAAISRMHEEGKSVDIITLTEELKRRKQYEKLGGDEFVNEILDGTPNAANTLDYAGIVLEKSITRNVILGCDDIRARSYANSESSENIVMSLRRLAMGLYARGTNGSLTPEMETMEDVVAEDMRWLMPGVLPLGVLCIFTGDGQTGKSFVCASIATTLSLGSPWPGGIENEIPPCDTIILSAEDSSARMIKPRLVMMGADPRRIHRLLGVVAPDGTRKSWTLDDMPSLERAIDMHPETRFMYFDPISSYCGGKKQTREEDVRPMIDPLGEMAERRDITIVMIKHLNKNTNQPAMYRSSDSIAFMNASRAAWVFGRDQTRSGHSIMCNVKLNGAPGTPPPISFAITNRGVEWCDETPEITADELLANPINSPKFETNGKEESARKEKTPSKAQIETADWILRRLQWGPIKISVIRNETEKIMKWAPRRMYRAHDYLIELGLVDAYEENNRKWLRATEAGLEYIREVDEGTAKATDETPEITLADLDDKPPF